MQYKAWYQSKVVWLNVIYTILAVCALFVVGGQFANVLSDVVVLWISIGMAVLNIILRIWFTGSTIE